MSLFINYPVTAAGVLALVTLLAYVGGNWRRDLYCPEYGFDGIDPGPYCYWSVVNALLVPCAITVSILGLGLVVRALSVTLAFVRLLSYSAARKTRDLVKVYPWYCLLAAVVLFGPWDRRPGWVVAGCLRRLALVLCAWLAAGTKLTLSYLVRIASTAWSRIQLETAVCERVRTKVIDSHVAFGLIWLPFFASETGNHWLGYLWRTTNPHARCRYSLPKSGLDAPTLINFEKLRAQLMEDAAEIAARRCGRISAAMIRLLGGRSFVYSWTLDDEFARLEREHPEKEGLEAWKQEKERQAGIWNAIQAERKASQVIPGAYDTGIPCPNPPTLYRRTHCGGLSGGGIVGDMVSVVLLNVLNLSSFLRFPARLSLSSCPTRPTPASGPVLADPIGQSLPRVSVADSSSHSSQRKQLPRRTGFGASSSRSTTLDRLTPPTPRSHQTPDAAVAAKTATRAPVVHTRPRATARAPTCRSNLTSGLASERAVLNVPAVDHLDPKPATVKPPAVTPAKIARIPLPAHDEISYVPSDSTGSELVKFVEGFTVLDASPLSSPVSVSIEPMLNHCRRDDGPLQLPIVPAMPQRYTSSSCPRKRKYSARDHTLAASDSLDPGVMTRNGSWVSVDIVTSSENRQAPLTPSELHAYTPTSIVPQLVPVPRAVAPALVAIKTDFPSAFSAAGVLVSSTPPPFSCTAIEMDEVIFDAVDTPDATMSSPELKDTDMFYLPTPPSPMLVELPEVPEALMDSPPLPCQSDMKMDPGVDPTINNREAIVPVYMQPGAWEGFMMWHQEQARSAVVPACHVPPVPQAWSQPAVATNSDAASTSEDVGHAWTEASPEPTYTNSRAPAHAPVEQEACLRALFAMGQELSTSTPDILPIPDSWSHPSPSPTWAPSFPDEEPGTPSAQDDEADDLDSSDGDLEERWAMVVQLHRKLSATTNRVRRRRAGSAERRVTRLEKRLAWDEVEWELEETCSRPRGNRHVERSEDRSRRGVAC